MYRIPFAFVHTTWRSFDICDYFNVIFYLHLPPLIGSVPVSLCHFAQQRFLFFYHLIFTMYNPQQALSDFYIDVWWICFMFYAINKSHHCMHICICISKKHDIQSERKCNVLFNGRHKFIMVCSCSGELDTENLSCWQSKSVSLAWITYLHV